MRTFLAIQEIPQLRFRKPLMKQTLPFQMAKVECHVFSNIITKSVCAGKAPYGGLNNARFLHLLKITEYTLCKLPTVVV